ncbi:MAG: hypothetical protein H6728_05560 [Myxococcales bacterium]|nr:hypothetical protein [Myxococcales bacterium]MCB9642523.1 hypothetical protein [Myxococcales bacterium]
MRRFVQGSGGAFLFLWCLLASVGCDNSGKKACVEDRQCDINEYCDAKERRCTPGCSDDSRCPTGQSCYNKQCKERICGAKATVPTEETEPCYDGAPNEVETIVAQMGGQCRKGVRTCIQNGQTWSACYGQVRPREEICDGLDNDCDGKSDEGRSDCSCTTGMLRRCSTSPADAKVDKPDELGFCRSGVQRCGEDGRWGPCFGEIRPHRNLEQMEKCVDIDADCDGLPDADCLCDPSQATRSCALSFEGNNQMCSSTSKDVQNEGLQRCERRCLDPKKTDCQDAEAIHAWGPCRTADNKPLSLPAPEELDPCDGKDNDCDGKIDNRSDKKDLPLTRPCYPGLPGCVLNQEKTLYLCEGLCQSGVQRCVDGRWETACEGATLPQKEVCDDNQDNDCDGKIDSTDSDCP